MKQSLEKETTHKPKQNSDRGEGRGGQVFNGPEVNINLQIHISADASPDQIDQIFMSMSKHLYKHGQ